MTEDLKYKEVHTHTDIKLFLGYVSCAFAAYGSIKNYMTSFEESRLDLLVACIG